MCKIITVKCGQVAPVTQHVVAPLQEQQVDALLAPTTPDQQAAHAAGSPIRAPTRLLLGTHHPHQVPAPVEYQQSVGAERVARWTEAIQRRGGEVEAGYCARVTHLTPYMSRDNTVVIAKRTDGNKYRRARDWGIPVVSAAWLTDLLLGNMTALSQMFSAAAAGERRAKRARLEPPGASPGPPPPALAGAPHAAPPLHLAPRVLFSNVTPQRQNRVAAIVRQLGGLVVTSAAEATHLVMDKLARTCKLVSCLITVKHLLTTDWVTESQRINKFADEAEFALRSETFNSTFRCDIDEVLLSGETRKKLFEGITFYLTPCVKPAKASLTEMIELCGGRVEKNRRSYVSIQEMHSQKPFSYLVLTVPNDLHLVYYLLQSEKTLNVVCNTEVVLSAIMRQRLEIEEFLVRLE
ncbi:unnamed protein product [Leptidea sinapis]|uniref:PAX-interacting protein 1 n=1 Tax=Leptidea sinapis TaxID=189913 RepID=A0A5E4QCW8_9NEOP|nr:unnamed protein product [Leptidea sinapis]